MDWARCGVPSWAVSATTSSTTLPVRSSSAGSSTYQPCTDRPTYSDVNIVTQCSITSSQTAIFSHFLHATRRIFLGILPCMRDSDLRFLSPHPDTSLHCKTTETWLVHRAVCMFYHMIRKKRVYLRSLFISVCCSL